MAQLAAPELYTRAVDEFGVFVFGSIAIIVFVFLAIGKWYPGSGAEQVDWKPTRSYEDEVRLELEDVDQMIEAQNERRRASGRPEITEKQIRAEVGRETTEKQIGGEVEEESAGAIGRPGATARDRGLARVLIVGCGCRGRELAAELGRAGASGGGAPPRPGRGGR